MNKIIASLIVIVMTFIMIFAISALLDIAWIKSEIPRRIAVYLLMIICFLIGYLSFKAIFK